jgi:small subunit ribosomal protein S1
MVARWSAPSAGPIVPTIFRGQTVTIEKPADPETPTPDQESEAQAPASEFAQALEAFERTAAPGSAVTQDISPGMKVTGKVVAIGDEYLTIDFGGRSEGVAKAGPFLAEDGTLSIGMGDSLDLFVIESGDQILLATSIGTDSSDAVRHLREAKKGGVPISGKVTGVNTGGLEVSLGGARGFCPMSQIESGFCEDPSVHVGHTLEFLITSIEEGRGSAVLSRKKLLRRAEKDQAKQLLARIKPGDDLDATVARLEPFGAFVDLGGIDGLVHVSEISHERLAHPNEALKPGEKVRVRVLRLSKDPKGRMRIALSIKACAPDPWTSITTQFTPGTRVSGTVARLTDFGAFVTLAPGVDGLVHVSQVSAQRVEHVRDALTQGQTIEVSILNVDPERKRISLSMRDPAEASRASIDIPAAPRRPRGKPKSHAAPDAYVMPQKEEPKELTTMAIALRKAMEKSKQRK